MYCSESDVGRKGWDISPVFERKPPKPKFKLVCSSCGCKRIWFKELRIFQHWAGGYRMDINTKCDSCGKVEVYGIHLTKDEFEKLKKVLYDHRLHYTHTGHVLLGGD